jgi:hypothetical protein
MPTPAPVQLTWLEVARHLAAGPSRAQAEIAADLVEDPEAAGLATARGWPVGQAADWRLRLPDGRSLHVQDFGDRYRAHLDAVDPALHPVEHMLGDLPRVSLTGTLVLGGLAGLAATRDALGLCVGLACGVAAGKASTALVARRLRRRAGG